jgi:hypothetical protein
MRTSSYSGSVAFTVFPKPSEPFTTLQRALTCHGVTDGREEQDIAFALMITLVVSMLDVLVEHMPEGGFPYALRRRSAWSTAPVMEASNVFLSMRLFPLHCFLAH